MKTTYNAPLSPLTSLRVGGSAEVLVECDTYEEVVETLRNELAKHPVSLLGFGCNALISDSGLSGTTLVWRGGQIVSEDEIVIADAGVWWDDLVQFAIASELWGLELTSEVPSSVGGAVYGNIAAYGQQISDTLVYIDVFDTKKNDVRRIDANDIEFAYRHSSLQEMVGIYILRAAFHLSRSKSHDLRYASAVAVAHELGADTETLAGRRQTIVETRGRAGSIYHPYDTSSQRTAGSFFKNPMVTTEQAVNLASYDETGKTLKRINEQNSIHGGDTHRASAAHVLLAAGFKRGQTWDHVRLHPDHVLKIETLPGANGREVYDVAQEIIDTVKQKLDITIVPEVKFLGDF